MYWYKTTYFYSKLLLNVIPMLLKKQNYTAWIRLCTKKCCFTRNWLEKAYVLILLAVGKKTKQHSLRIHSLLFATAQLPYSSLRPQHLPDPSTFLVSLPYQFFTNLLNLVPHSSTTLHNLQAKNRETLLCLVQLCTHWLPVLKQKG